MSADERDSEGPEFRRELSKAEREVLNRIDPGGRAVLIAAVMLVLVVSAVLPWTGGVTGWQVITGQTDPALKIGLLPRMFAINCAIAGIGFGALALVTRRWAFAWLAAVGCGVVSFEGLIAIWSRQTAPESPPAIGLIIAVIGMVVLTSQWLRIAWSRT